VEDDKSEHSSRSRDDRGESGETNDAGGNRVVHNKIWLYGFLLHTLAYFGGSGYINYLSISTGKQLIAEGSPGPIDMYVSHHRRR
jgi:hypothetical protein